MRGAPGEDTPREMIGEEQTMAEAIPVVQYGLGPIGVATLRMVAERPWLRIVGAIDVDPGKVGRDVGEVAGLDRQLGVTVSADAETVLAECRPRAVVHCTGSFLPDVMGQLRLILQAGAAIVSTCEELAYPWQREPGLAAELDELARAKSVAVLGTGVNPGFVMDYLPLALSAVTDKVRGIRVTRLVAAGKRRGPLQQKIGAGIDPAEFERRKATGRMGHIGLRESVAMIAAGLGWDIGEIDDVLEPVIAQQAVETPHARVTARQVAGIHETARASTPDGKWIELDLQMDVATTDGKDEIVIEGDPGAHLVIPGGTFGDTATAAIAANAIPAVLRARPGLRTMLDMPPLTPGSRDI